MTKKPQVRVFLPFCSKCKEEEKGDEIKEESRNVAQEEKDVILKEEEDLNQLKTISLPSKEASYMGY